MSIIYCKASDNRKKIYQIYTRIHQENEKKWVEKESVYPEGKAHIRQIHENMETLKKLYGKTYTVMPCELQDDVVLFSFVKGITLEEKMLCAIKKDLTLETVQEQFAAWIEIIEGNADNIMAFEITPEFKEIFGEAEELVACKALKVCNFDCNCDNIIFNGSTPTIFDYEWVYTFPIPFDLVLYRLLSDLYSRSPILRQHFDFEQILNICGVQAHRSVLERLSSNFYLSVLIEKDTQIDMDALGRCHTTSPIIPIKNDCLFSGTIYFDTGSGFSEEEKSEFVFYQAENFINWNGILPQGCKTVRFDPVEGFCCAVCALGVVAGVQKMTPVPLNGVAMGAYLFFNTTDPQILIELPDNYSGQLEITVTILPFKDQEYLLFAQVTNQLEKTADKLQTQLDTATTELAHRENELSIFRQELQITAAELAQTENELSTMKQEMYINREQYYTAVSRYRELEQSLMAAESAYAVISNAFFWKITKPARSFMDWIKSFFFLNLAIKGLKCLKQNGLKYTWRKTSGKLQIAKRLPKNSGLILTENSKTSYNVNVSVIIPTFQGRNYIKGLMTSLNNQLGINRIEIIVVDSGSTDGTAEIAEQRGAKVIRISQSEFSHSYARNLGAESATGDYLLFMTQDSLPSSQYFIFHMLTPLLKHGASAASCAEKPYTDCWLSYRVNNDEFMEFLGVTNSDRLCSLPQKTDYHSLRANGQLIDIACIIKRDIFFQMKYRGDFAEDLDLGLRIIRSGQKIALLSSAQVIHSHNRPCGYYLKRGYADTINLKKILPEMPICSLSSTELIDATLCAYYKTICIIDLLNTNYRDNMNLDKVFEMINEFWKEVRNDDMIIPQAMLFGRPYMDKTLERFIADLRDNYKGEFCKSNLLMEQVMGYINGPMRKYLGEHTEQYEFWLRRNDQIADAIISRFALLAGANLAQYDIMNAGSDTFKRITAELIKGI